MSKKMTGKQALLEMLRAEGITFIFGNPGTSEGPIVDMLGDYPDIRYILTLLEWGNPTRGRLGKHHS